MLHPPTSPCGEARGCLNLPRILLEPGQGRTVANFRRAVVFSTCLTLLSLVVLRNLGIERCRLRQVLGKTGLKAIGKGAGS